MRHWRCAIRINFCSKLACVSLLAAIAGLRAFAGNDIDLLRKICEEQNKRAGRLESHSYTVHCEGQHEFEHVNLPIRTDQRVTWLNGNLRMSRSQYVSGAGVQIVINELQREELLLNEEMLMVRTDRKNDNLKVYFKSNFDASSLEEILSTYVPYDPMAMRYTTEAPETLSTYAEALANNPKWTWKIDAQYNEKQDPTLYVLTRLRPEEDRPDIIIHVDPTKDYVVSKFVCQPYRQPDNYRRSTVKEFENVNGQWIVSRYEFLEVSDDYPQPVMKLSLSFKDIAPTPPEAAVQMSTATLNLPSRIGVDVATPNAGRGTRIDSSNLEYLNGNFVPASGLLVNAPPGSIPIAAPFRPKQKIDKLIDWAIQGLIYLIP